MKPKLFLFFILFIGAFLRFYNLNWDMYMHLHPDERFLTMVGMAMKLPTSFWDYLTPSVSSFNPTNIGFPFFVYGIFPLIINKLFALFLHTDTYTLFTLQGRLISGLCDLLIIIVIYKLIALLEDIYVIDTKVKYIAGLLYALSVLPIQLAHFFATDTFLNFFTVTSLYFAVRFRFKTSILSLLASAVLLGLATATKITAIYMVPLISFTLFLSIPKQKGTTLRKFIKIYSRHIPFVLCFLLITYGALRIADPYLFQSNNFLDTTVNTTLVQNLAQLSSFNSPDAFFPPSVQWITKPIFFFSFYNLVLYGIGIPHFFFLLIGIFVVYKKYKKSLLSIFILYIILFFLYQSFQFVKVMRYFLSIYPLFAVIGAIGWVNVYNKYPSYSLRVPMLLSLFIWPLLFLSIYVYPHTRVQASQWIYRHIPSPAIILTEHWDDPLPLPVESSPKIFTIEQLPVFDPDTPEKWTTIHRLLDKGDYLILSSNRGWGSIPTVPYRYPQMTIFYKELLANKTEYILIKEFTSYPSLHYLGIPVSITDDFADESFTVYDHPKVLIFQKRK